jgi:hypothetical protein
VVGARTHRDHRAALGQFGVAGELPRHPGHRLGRHRGDHLLPGRRVGLRVVVAGRPRPRQAVAGHRVLRHQQVKDGGDQPPTDPADRDPAADHAATLRVTDIEPGQVDRDRVLVCAIQREDRIDTAEIQVPFALTRLREVRGQGAVGEERLAGGRVEQDALVHGRHIVGAEVRGGQEPVRDVGVAVLPQGDQERQVRVGLHVVGEVRHLPVPEELGQDHVAHRHGQRPVGPGIAGQPVVGELGVVGVVRADHHHLLAPVTRLDHEVRVRSTGDRQVGAPDHQIRRVPPVARLGDVGLVAEHLRRGDRHVGVPVIERQDRAADHRQEPGTGRVGDLRHRRDR